MERQRETVRGGAGPGIEILVNWTSRDATPGERVPAYPKLGGCQSAEAAMMTCRRHEKTFTGGLDVSTSPIGVSDGPPNSTTRE